MAVVTLAIVGLVLIITLSISWHKANQLNRLNDSDLYKSLYAQLSPTEPTDGRIWSPDDFSNVQLFIVDDVTKEQPELQAVQIFVYDEDTNTASIVDVPLNTKVWLSEGVSYLPAQFEAGGAAQALPPLTNATNVHVSHVIVATDRIWDQLNSFEGPAIKALFTKQTNDFATISSDFDSAELIEFAERVQEIGLDNIYHVEAACWGDVLADGTEVSVVDWQELPTQVGIFTWPA